MKESNDPKSDEIGMEEGANMTIDHMLCQRIWRGKCLWLRVKNIATSIYNGKMP